MFAMIILQSAKVRYKREFFKIFVK